MPHYGMLKVCPGLVWGNQQGESERSATAGGYGGKQKEAGIR